MLPDVCIHCLQHVPVKRQFIEIGTIESGECFVSSLINSIKYYRWNICMMIKIVPVNYTC